MERGERQVGYAANWALVSQRNSRAPWYKDVSKEHITASQKRDRRGIGRHTSSRMMAVL